MAYSKGVLAVVGAKGGVGKTTTSLNLAAAMAAAGRSVVAVELDIGMANFVDFLDVDGDDGATIHDVLAGESTIESARRRVADGFFIAPSGTQLTGYANTDLARLPGVVDDLAWYHDAIVLDTPAGVGEEIVRSLELADEAILVSTPRVASIRNAKNTIELTDRIGTDVRGLVLTKSGTGASPGADRIAGFLDVPLLGHVPEDDAVPHSQDRGQPVVDYAPRSGAAIAYRTIAGKLLDDAPASERSTPEADDRDGRSDVEDGPREDRARPAESSEPVRPTADGTGGVVDRPYDRASGSTASTAGAGEDPDRTTAEDEPRRATTDSGRDERQPAADSSDDREAAEPPQPNERAEAEPTATDGPPEPTATDGPPDPIDGRPTPSDDGEDGSDGDAIGSESARDDSTGTDPASDDPASDDSTGTDPANDDPASDDSTGTGSIDDPDEDGVDRDVARETDADAGAGDPERTEEPENDSRAPNGAEVGDSAGDTDAGSGADVDESDSVGGRIRGFLGL